MMLVLGKEAGEVVETKADGNGEAQWEDRDWTEMKVDLSALLLYLRRLGLLMEETQQFNFLHGAGKVFWKICFKKFTGKEVKVNEKAKCGMFIW